MDMVCTEMPIGCETTSTFLLDTSYFQNALDIRADDNGKWHLNGRKSEFIGIDEDGNVYDLEEKSGTLTLGRCKASSGNVAVRIQWRSRRY